MPLNVPLTALNTFFLICSSVTMVKAFAAIQAGDQRGLKLWLLATILIGALFVGIQAVEYTILSGEHFLPIAEAYARLILWMEADFGWNRWQAYDVLTHIGRISVGYYGIGTVATKIERRYLERK